MIPIFWKSLDYLYCRTPLMITAPIVLCSGHAAGAPDELPDGCDDDFAVREAGSKGTAQVAESRRLADSREFQGILLSGATLSEDRPSPIGSSYTLSGQSS